MMMVDGDATSFFFSLIAIISYSYILSHNISLIPHPPPHFFFFYSFFFFFFFFLFFFFFFFLFCFFFFFFFCFVFFVFLFGFSDYLVRDFYLYANILHRNFLRFTPQLPPL